jgi:hypothetical protein
LKAPISSDREVAQIDDETADQVAAVDHRKGGYKTDEILLWGSKLVMGSVINLDDRAPLPAPFLEGNGPRAPCRDVNVKGARSGSEHVRILQALRRAG